MSCGLACVVSRLAGAAELIKERESGSLINDPTDPKEIAQLLLPLIENKSVRQTMGAAARSVAQNRSWDIVAKEYADVVETLIASKARPL
jgi:glycosyltransferase involved in cell wall biosynthesis